MRCVQALQYNKTNLSPRQSLECHPVLSCNKIIRRYSAIIQTFSTKNNVATVVEGIIKGTSRSFAAKTMRTKPPSLRRTTMKRKRVRKSSSEDGSLDWFVDFGQTMQLSFVASQSVSQSAKPAKVTNNHDHERIRTWPKRQRRQ